MVSKFIIQNLVTIYLYHIMQSIYVKVTPLRFCKSVINLSNRLLTFAFYLILVYHKKGHLSFLLCHWNRFHFCYILYVIMCHCFDNLTQKLYYLCKLHTMIPVPVWLNVQWPPDNVASIIISVVLETGAFPFHARGIMCRLVSKRWGRRWDWLVIIIHHTYHTETQDEAW